MQPFFLLAHVCWRTVYWYMLHYFISYPLLETGDCRGFIPRWYYNINNTKCETFTYGGCGGNENKFETEDECERNCSGSVPATEGWYSIHVHVNCTCMKTVFAVERMHEKKKKPKVTINILADIQNLLLLFNCIVCCPISYHVLLLWRTALMHVYIRLANFTTKLNL